MRILGERAHFQADHSSTSYLFYSPKRLDDGTRQPAASFSRRPRVGVHTAAYTYNLEGYELPYGAEDKLLAGPFEAMISESYDWWTLVFIEVDEEAFALLAFLVRGNWSLRELAAAARCAFNRRVPVSEVAGIVEALVVRDILEQDVRLPDDGRVAGHYCDAPAHIPGLPYNDSALSSPITVHWAITYRCALTCPHCYTFAYGDRRFLTPTVALEQRRERFVQPPCFGMPPLWWAPICSSCRRTSGASNNHSGFSRNRALLMSYCSVPSAIVADAGRGTGRHSPIGRYCVRRSGSGPLASLTCRWKSPVVSLSCWMTCQPKTVGHDWLSAAPERAGSWRFSRTAQCCLAPTCPRQGIGWGISYQTTLRTYGEEPRVFPVHVPARHHVW